MIGRAARGGNVLLWVFLTLALVFLGGAGLLAVRELAPQGVSVGVAYSTAPLRRSAEGAMLATIKAYVEWHNALGREPRLRLEIVSYLADPTSALLDLKRRGVCAVVGFSTSDTVSAALSVAERFEVPLIAVSASSSLFSKKDDWLFRVRSSARDDAVAYARLMRSRGVRRFVVAAETGNAPYVFSTIKGIYDQGSPLFAGVVRIEDLLSSSFASPLSPDGVLILAPSAPSVWMAQRVRAVWPFASIFLSPWSIQSLPKGAPRLVGGEFFAADVFSPLRIRYSLPFVRFWKSRYGDINVVTHCAYVAMELLLKAIADAGTTEPRALRESLARPRTIGGVAADVEIDRFGDAHAPMVFLEYGPDWWTEMTLP